MTIPFDLRLFDNLLLSVAVKSGADIAHLSDNPTPHNWQRMRERAFLAFCVALYPWLSFSVVAVQGR